MVDRVRDLVARPGRRSFLGASLVAAVACNGPERRADSSPQAGPPPRLADDDDDAKRSIPPDAGTTPARPPEPSGPPPDVWPALPATLDPPATADGVPILRVTTRPPATAGALREVSPAWNTLAFAQIQASDGLSTFIAVRNQAQTYSDVVIRGGELRTNVLQALAGTELHPGGCGAAADGIMLLTAPAPIPGETQSQIRVNADGSRTTSTIPQIAQEVWVVTPDGALAGHRLPPTAGNDAECEAVLEKADRFAIFASNLAEYDGTTFHIDRSWFSGRTHLTRPFGPRYCFASCNAQEQAGTDPSVTKALDAALGRCDAEYAVLGDLIAARCRGGSTVVRMRVGNPVETLAGLPKADWLADDVFLTRDGHAVLELSLEMKTYAVWPAGSPTLGPVRTLGDDEVLAQTSPTVLVQNLPEAVPPADVYAVVLGVTLPFGASGSTFDYRSHSAGPTAHAARSKRAAAVLPAGDFVLAHEAAVQLACGAYVRSPLGHEGDVLHDFVPPELPPLSKKAVHVPSECLPLSEVHALPGDPDLLLARTEAGRLALAWLPPPLPLPSGHDPRDPTPSEPAPVQHPRPGSGWTVLGAVDRIEGDRGVPSPGADTAIRGGWQAGGGAVLEIGSESLVLTRGGAWTVPPGTKPMAVQTGPAKAKLYGALGSKLVVCDQRCRTLDPGDGRDIVAVVPRTESEIILGFGEDETAVYRVPGTGGTETPPHALEAALEAQLAAKPMP